MGSIGQAIGGFLNPLSPILGVLGGVGNTIMGATQGQGAKQAQKAALNAANQEQQMASQLYNMTPAQLSQRLQAMEQPLSQNLITNTANQVMPALAQAGLGGSAGQVQNALGTALAPANLQEQQMAQNLMNMQFSLPMQGQSNVMSALSGLMRWPQPASNAPAFAPPTPPGQPQPNPNPTPSFPLQMPSPITPPWSGGPFDPSQGIPNIPSAGSAFPWSEGSGLSNSFTGMF